MNKASLVALTACALAPLAAEASFASFDYSAVFGDVPITASGVLEYDDALNADGSNTVTGISGTRTAGGELQTITGLLGPYSIFFSYDNDLFLDPSLNDGHYFTFEGLLYGTLGASGEHSVNLLYNADGSGDVPVGYLESSFTPSPNYLPYAVVTSLTIQNVPEPASAALAGIALMGMTVVGRCGRRTPRRAPSAAAALGA